MAESFLKRAFNKLNEARSSLENHYYAESVSASQECIELSVKAIFLLQEEYPKRHEFKEEEFEAILKRSRRSLSI
jgi:HEPN domain-containing protein